MHCGSAELLSVLSPNGHGLTMTGRSTPFVMTVPKAVSVYQLPASVGAGMCRSVASVLSRGLRSRGLVHEVQVAVLLEEDVLPSSAGQSLGNVH